MPGCDAFRLCMYIATLCGETFNFFTRSVAVARAVVSAGAYAVWWNLLLKRICPDGSLTACGKKGRILQSHSGQPLALNTPTSRPKKSDGIETVHFDSASGSLFFCAMSIPTSITERNVSFASSGGVACEMTDSVLSNNTRASRAYHRIRSALGSVG